MTPISLIISCEEDISTYYVMEWANYFGKNIVRINDTDVINIEWISIANGNQDFLITHENFKLSFSKIISFWYRRGEIKMKLPHLKDVKNQVYLKNKINNFLSFENSATIKYLNLQLQKKRHINYIDDNYTNKLNNLALAADIGFKIPKTIITSKKTELRTFLNRSQNGIITKGIYSSFEFTKNDDLFVSMTEIFDKNIKNIPNNFCPTLFQELIVKKVELRIFFLENKYFAAAIFSQQKNNTIVDSKLEDINAPHRVIPFNLPIEVMKKLDTLMSHININSGSIDMILTPELDYVFLEVNPIGQFGMVSKPCNYYLEKKMAKFLKNQNNNEKKIN